MESNISTMALRGSHDWIARLRLCIGPVSYEMPDMKTLVPGQYNVRCVFEKVAGRLTYGDSMLGEMVSQSHWRKVRIDDNPDVRLLSPDGALLEYKMDFSLQGVYDAGVKVFKDTPVHHFPALDALPVPVDMLTVYFYFSETEIDAKRFCPMAEKYFDAYSDLGFFLADLAKMEEVIIRKYGDRQLDLVDEFSNTELIDELFCQGSILITWGIPPYAYPIYSCEDIGAIRPLLGRKFGQEGLFRMDEDVNELSLIPGYELRRWPDFVRKPWPKIALKGKGKIVHLTPYVLEDADFETVVVSFLIHRSEGVLEESVPLLNVNLLDE